MMQYNYRCRVCQNIQYRVETTGIRDWEYGIPGEFFYYRCASCGTVQIHPFPDYEFLKQAYNVDYHGYAKSTEKGILYRVLYAVNDRMFQGHIKKHLSPGCAILDIGCGSGEFLEKMAFLGLSRIDGIDFSEKSIAMATARGVNTYCGIFSDFSSAPQTYDAIFMNNYLEHTVDPVYDLEKAHKLLKPGGLLMGEVPNFQAIGRLLFGRYWGGNHIPRHTIQFDQNTLKKILKKTKFKNIAIAQGHNTGHLALSIQNYLQRNKPDLYINKSLKHGRASYYSLLLFVLIPLNTINVLFRRAGFLKFYASAG